MSLLNALSAARIAFFENLRDANRNKAWLQSRNAPRYRQEWSDYINSEVTAVCNAKGWQIQIRRKWSVREQTVNADTVKVTRAEPDGSFQAKPL